MDNIIVIGMPASGKSTIGVVTAKRLGYGFIEMCIRDRRKTGARGLRGILESTMTEIMYEIPSRDDVEKCIITKETIEMKGRPKLVLKASSQLKDQEANAS